MSWHYPTLSQKERQKVRGLYIEKQSGLCYYCKHPLNKNPPETVMKRKVNWGLFPRGKDFLKYPIHLHHDHRTGYTLGAVHAMCNAVLWQYHGE